MSEIPPEDQLREDSIGYVLSEVLETINTTFLQAGVELPTRQYIAIGGAGETVHDCEQLTVSFEQIYSGLPGAQAQVPTRCEGPRSMVVIVELVRCVPSAIERRGGSPIPPDITALNEYALSRSRDAWLLEDGLLAAAEGFYYLGGMADITAGGVQGQYQALVGTLVVGIP